MNMKNTDNIKGLINKELLQNQIAINSDGYGSACVNVAINIMEHLDGFEGEFNIGYSPDMTTTHGIICKCDDQGGITGFMAGAARNIVAQCYKDGWKFWLADVISSYDVDDAETLERNIENISKNGLTSKEDATKYVEALVNRYKENFGSWICK
jgi:hypothetical protein